jgi:hypothetical protein
MGETRVIRPGVRERREAELANAAQALHFRGLEEPRNDLLLRCFERDQAVNGVAKDHAEALQTT